MAGRPVRLRRRLTIAFVIVAGVSAAALAIGSYLMVSRARFDDSLTRAAADLRYQLVLAQQFLPLDSERRASLLASFEESGHHVVLVTDDGTAASSSPAFAATPSAATRSTVASGELAYQRIDSHLLLVGGRIPDSTVQLYVVHLEEPIHQDLSQLGTTLTAGWILTVLVAALVGHLLARRTLEPVGRASAAARAMAEGRLTTRLPVQGRDEFGAWAMSFNRMADALQTKIIALSDAEARERRFTADVAHELRTPVTALVGAASLLREHLDALPPQAHRPAQLLVADVVRLRHLVEELMEISRLDAGQEQLSIQPTDISALVGGIIAQHGWQEVVEVVGGGVGLKVVADTDPRRLERVLANLIANAVHHGQRDVRVAVSIVDGPLAPGPLAGPAAHGPVTQGPMAAVTVTDTGPGIAPEHLARIFERFYKADPARSGSGSGLGLAIARENARLLGARLDVRSSLGAGTEFRLELPVTQRLPGSEETAGHDAEGQPV